MDMCAAEASEHPGHLPRYLGAGQGRRPWWHRDGDVAGDGGDDEEGYDVFGWQLTPYKGTTFQGWGHQLTIATAGNVTGCEMDNYYQ